MQKDVEVVIGAGGMGRVIARRIGAGRRLLLADFDEATLHAAAELLRGDGHQVTTRPVDVSDAESVRALARTATELGPVRCLAHTAGVSPTQAPAEVILKVDLLGTALVLDAFTDVVAPGAAAVVIASMSAHMTAKPDRETERLLATVPSGELPRSALPGVRAGQPRRRLRDRQARQSSARASRRQDLGREGCARQLDQPRRHLHLDGPGGTRWCIRANDARHDRRLRVRTAGHTR